MTDVWSMPAIARWEKTCGNIRHKALSVLARIIMANTRNQENGFLIRLPVVAQLGLLQTCQNRRYLGIDKETEYIELGKGEGMEIEDSQCSSLYRSKIKDFKLLQNSSEKSVIRNNPLYQKHDLPFNAKIQRSSMDFSL